MTVGSMDACLAAVAIVDGEPILCLSDRIDRKLVGTLTRLLANLDARCAVPTCGFDESMVKKA